MPAYSKTTWIDGSAPAIEATNLNKMEQGIFDSLRQDGSTTMSGQLVTTAGSAATPAIAPTGDSNTGIFFPAADTIAFGEGGAEAMRINSSGQVGIGCDATSALEVKAAQGVIKLASTTGTNSTYHKIDNTGGTLTLGIDNSTGSSQFGAGNYAGGLWHSGNYNLTFGTNNSVRMTISGGGNVGIGTTSPAYTLDTNGIVRAKNAFYIGRSTDSAVIGSVKEGTSNGLKIQAESGGTDSTITFATNGGDRAIITSAGNVGIGTTSPDVFSRGYSGTILGISSSGQSAIELNSATGNSTYLDFGVAATRKAAIQTTSSDMSIGTLSTIPLYFITNSSTKMTITDTGNVGIGTTSPTSVLEIVNGSNTYQSMINGINNHARLGIKTNSSNSAGITFSTDNETNTWFLGSRKDAAGGSSGTDRLNLLYNSSTFLTVSTAGYLLIGYTSSNGAYPLQVNGQIFATSSTIATSDGRYKKDVVSLDGALDIVKALNPVQFSWKDHPVHKFNTDVPTVGFIAQEVEQALADKSYLTSIIKKSECTWETETGETIEREVTRDVEKQVTREVEREITETIDGEEVTRTITEEVIETVIEQVTEIVTEPVKETHTEEFLGIAESNLIAILTKAVKELTAKVEALEAQLNK